MFHFGQNNFHVYNTFVMCVNKHFKLTRVGEQQNVQLDVSSGDVFAFFSIKKKLICLKALLTILLRPI